VDLSEQMIGHARRQEIAAPLGIDFRVGDAQILDALADGAFAGVVANLSLNNVDDLAAAVHTLRRVLRPGGWLVFTIPHPCFETPHASPATTPDGRAAQLVAGYFEERFWRSDIPRASAGRATGTGRWRPSSTPWSMAALSSRGSLNRSRARRWPQVIRGARMCRCFWSCGRLGCPSRQAH
jgi:SAM-dependent methyltransferase